MASLLVDSDYCSVKCVICNPLVISGVSYPDIDKTSGFGSSLTGLTLVYPGAVLPYIYEFVINTIGRAVINKVCFAENTAVRATDANLVEIAAGAGSQYYVGKIVLASGIPDFHSAFIGTGVTNIAAISDTIESPEMIDHIRDIYNIAYIAAAATYNYTYSGFTTRYLHDLCA